MIERLEAEGHTITDSPTPGKIIVTLKVEPETIIDNPDPKDTP